jgi:putative membrane protein
VSTFFAFLHHVAAFTLVAALAVESVLIRQEVTRPGAIRLLATDAVLGASATTLLVVGLLRVFYFEKGASYYFSSYAFLTKLSVFLVVARCPPRPPSNSCHGARP